MTTTKVQVLKNGQYVTTIPRSLAEALKLTSGSDLDWEVIGRGELSIKKV